MMAPKAHRILVIDDNPAIHDDFKKILSTDHDADAALAAAEAALFDKTPAEQPLPMYEICSAYQGQDGVKMVTEAKAAGRPFALAFVDMRMPPGWDGIETINHLWKEDSDLQVVICTAYTDYSWEEMTRRLGRTDRLLILKKPFDTIEARQFASAMTQKWALAQMLTKHVNNLEALIAERTAELHRSLMITRENEKHLRQAQKMEAVGQLAGGVAHDFNNLLTVILGTCEQLLMKTTPENPMIRKLELIHKTADRAANLTRQLLAFSRKQVLDPKILDVNDIITDMERMLSRLIPENIELTSLLNRNLKRVKVDPSQFEQVIMNLVVNARDAMPNGGKLLIETNNVELDESYISTHTLVKPGAYVLVAVSDTGIGMTPEIKAHIFEPFFTTKEPGKGTGLGLSTVYGIVRQSGGHIEAYSEPGAGTTFRIYLPLAEGQSPAIAMTPLPPLVGGRKEVILIVEDQDDMREFLKETFEASDYTVLTACNGQDGLRVAKEHAGAIQLLLTDVIMPVMNGPDLAEKMAEARPDTKVLFMSGYTDHAVIHNSSLREGRFYIQKPFSSKNVLRKVQEILRANAIIRPAAGATA